MDDDVTKARAEERERCARIVENHPLPSKLAEAWQLEVAIITRKIRTRIDL
jgi:hypothetical protein